MTQDIKKDTTGKKVTHSHLRLQCGDCMHFKGTAHPSIGKPCQTLGVRARATAPDCYTANIAVFRPLGPEFIQNLVVTLSVLEPTQTRVLMGLMKQSSSLEKAGFTFLQKVYFTIGGTSLQDWFTGFVFGVGPTPGTIQVVGRDAAASAKSVCTAVLMSKSVVTSHKKWVKIKRDLIDHGQLARLPERLRPLVQKDEYEPPTLETAQEKLETAAARMRKGRSNRFKVDSEGNGTLFSISQ